MRALNLKYLANGWIDATIEHPELGWIPHTAAPETGDPEAEAIWRALSARDDVAPYEPKPEAPPILSPRQFAWLLAYTGLEDVWGAVEREAKEQGDRELYASLRAQRASSTFLLGTTLAFKAHPAAAALAQQVAPDADLSDEAIRAAWEVAAAQTFDTLV